MALLTGTESESYGQVENNPSSAFAVHVGPGLEAPAASTALKKRILSPTLQLRNRRKGVYRQEGRVGAVFSPP